MKAIPEFRPEQLALPATLPVHAHAEALIHSIAENPVTIVCGATGSGKSTQLPKLALRAGRQSIAHTQPRRLAARTLAERIATEMQCTVGTAVGWQVRFAQALSAETCVKLVTDGVLLSELRHDPKLRRYDTVIIDEAHERSLNIDFLLGCLHRLLRQRPELRLIITSATLDAEKFSAHFDGAPVFEVEGRGYPVEIRYLEPEGGDLQAGVVQALRVLWKEGPGDVLVFLPGEREIRDLRDSLSRAPELSRYGEAEFLPLYARLPSAQQQRIFNPTRSGRRVILATNVAETSLTVPGIRYVIDSGLARIARFSPRTQLQSLAIEAVAQDASAQRAGRCGRTAPGICIRLYPEEDFASRPAETVPEILRSNLGDVVLQMADRHLGQAEDFPFVDPPDNRLLRDARRLLLQLQALREDGRLTPTGKQMARLPVEPRFARMLVEAARTACLDEVVIIVAALSMPDVRDIGPESREAAAQLQADWKDKSSDFHGLLRMHAAIRAAREDLGRSAFERWCKEHFLSPRRVREWEDLIHQLHRELRAAGIRPPEQSPGDIHRALLSGLIDHLGQHEDNGDYRGLRGSRWRIHPESALRRSRAAWVFAASLVSTQRTYARTVAQTDAATILAAAGPLVRRSAADASWEPKRGEVMCTEQCRVFGLLVDSSRRVPLSKHDPEAARQIFLREALVLGDWGPGETPRFLRQNAQVMADIRADEARLRRRDLLCSEEDRYALYAEALPEEVHSRQTLLRWLSTQPATTLCWSRDSLQAHSAGSLLDAWPTQVDIRGQKLRLRYSFAPGDAADGVSVELPVEGLMQFRAEDFAGCVPGLAEKQLDALLRRLPKADRKLLIPLADTIAQLQAATPYGPDFLPQLRMGLEKKLGHGLPAQLLDLDSLPDNLRLRFVLKGSGPAKRRPLGAGRDLPALQAAHGERAQSAAESALADQTLPAALTQFPQPSPRWEQRSPSGTPLRLVLRDRGQNVDVAIASSAADADGEHAAGLRRLAWLRLKPKLALRTKALKPLRALRELPAAIPEPWPAALQYLNGDGSPADNLAEALSLRALTEVEAALTQATDRPQFEAAVDAAWNRLDTQLQTMLEALERIDALWPPLRLKLALEPANSPLPLAAALLLGPGFVQRTVDWATLPRYVEALAARREKRDRNPGADHDRQQQLHSFESRYLQAIGTQPAKARRGAYLKLFWALQDYRVSLFAQELRVPHPVSPKKLHQLFLQLTGA